MRTWRPWIGSPPARKWRVVIADLPDGVVAGDPVPIGPPVVVDDLPAWFNVAGRVWRLADESDDA
jgi:hypothetical protein